MIRMAVIWITPFTLHSPIHCIKENIYQITCVLLFTIHKWHKNNIVKFTKGHSLYILYCMYALYSVIQYNTT